MMMMNIKIYVLKEKVHRIYEMFSIQYHIENSPSNAYFQLEYHKNKKSSILFLLKRHLERDIRRQKITYVACVACHIDRIRKDCKNVVLCQSCCYATVSEFLYSFFYYSKIRCTFSQIISRWTFRLNNANLQTLPFIPCHIFGKCYSDIYFL